MSDPYIISFTDTPVNGDKLITRQELITYEWRGNHLCKIRTIRQFYRGGSDYTDTQTVEVLHLE